MGAKATNESELLDHMTAMFKRENGIMSGFCAEWVKGKVGLLEATHAALSAQTSEGLEPPSRVKFVDIGIGDMMPWEAWQPFIDRSISYIGVEGTPFVLERARGRHPDLDIVECRFSELADTVNLIDSPDVLVALDVLYHIPEQEVYDHVMSVLFDQGEHSAVILSFAPNTDWGSGGDGPGTNGFGWFPRPFVVPGDWSVINTATCTVGTVAQVALALVRA
jgi:hypothetical protein